MTRDAVVGRSDGRAEIDDLWSSDHVRPLGWTTRRLQGKSRRIDELTADLRIRRHGGCHHEVEGLRTPPSSEGDARCAGVARAATTRSVDRRSVHRERRMKMRGRWAQAGWRVFRHATMCAHENERAFMVRASPTSRLRSARLLSDILEKPVSSDDLSRNSRPLSAVTGRFAQAMVDQARGRRNGPVFCPGWHFSGCVHVPTQSCGLVTASNLAARGT